MKNFSLVVVAAKKSFSVKKSKPVDQNGGVTEAAAAAAVLAPLFFQKA